jgi:hypothetical protein
MCLVSGGVVGMCSLNAIHIRKACVCDGLRLYSHGVCNVRALRAGMPERERGGVVLWCERSELVWVSVASLCSCRT